jgi:hypothetical protein
MIKLVSLFLIVIVVLAMFGKLGWLGALAPPSLRKNGRLGKPAICIRCGRHIIGKAGCDCTASKKG